jgi:hypothetical protein
VRVETADGSRCLYQDPSTPAHVRNWTLARVLATSLLTADAVDLPAALVASSLMLPEVSMARELCETSESIASRYVAPVGAVLLRVADLAQRPTALVLPHWSRVAGNESGALPTDHDTLRELAFGRVGLLRLRRTRTPDGEVAIRVASPRRLVGATALDDSGGGTMRGSSSSSMMKPLSTSTSDAARMAAQPRARSTRASAVTTDAGAGGTKPPTSSTSFGSAIALAAFAASGHEGSARSGTAPGAGAYALPITWSNEIRS